MQLLSPFIIMYFCCCAIEWTLSFKKFRERCYCSKFNLLKIHCAVWDFKLLYRRGMWSRESPSVKSSCNSSRELQFSKQVREIFFFSPSYKQLHYCFTTEKELYRLCVYRHRPDTCESKVNNFCLILTVPLVIHQ